MRDLDPTSCKAFWFAAVELNFSSAAKKAGMTQPGISKHIAKLEEQLNASLFVRNSRKMALTNSGMLLKNYLDTMWADYDRLYTLISSENFEVSGDVKYAMPESCLMSPHFNLLLKSREKNFKNINLDVTIGHNSNVESLIVDRKVDFGFLTVKSNKVNCIEFCEEEFILVGRKAHTIKTKKDLLGLRFINHPDLVNYFQTWKNAFFSKTFIHFNELKIVNSMNDMRGVVTMLTDGPESDVTLIPKHCVLKELADKKLKVLNPTSIPVLNQIYIASNGSPLSMRVQRVHDEFFNILKSK